MRSNPYRANHLLTAALAVAATLACTGGQGEGSDTAGAAPTTSTATSPNAARAGGEDKAVEAPRRMSMEEFGDSTRRVEYGRTLDYRPNWGKPDLVHYCELGSGGLGDCRLSIAPVSGVVKVPLAEFDSGGRIIAKLYNDGPGRDTHYNIAPKDSAFLHVRRETSSDGTGILVARVYAADDGRLLRPHPRTRLKFWPTDATVPNRIGYVWRACDGEEHRRQRQTDSTLAHFGGCSGYPPPGHHGLSDTLGFPKGVLRQHTSPAWITCAEGCCAVAVLTDST